MVKEEYNMQTNPCSENYNCDASGKHEQIIKSAQREKALREIIASSVGTFDIEKITNSIVTQTGKLFNADRCFFVGYDKETDSCVPIKVYAEYLSSASIKSHLTRPTEKHDTNAFASQMEGKKIIIVENVGQLDLPEPSKKLMEDLSVKSYLIARVGNGDELYGSIVLHYVEREMKFSPDDIKAIEAISVHTATMIQQAELYKQMAEQADREKLTREIVSALCCTLDFNEIRKIIVTKIGMALNADISLLYATNYNTRKYLPLDEHSIYTSDKGFDLSLDKNILEDYEWTKTMPFKEHLEMIYSDIEDLKRDYNLHGTKSEEYLDKYQIKSNISVPIVYANKFLGILSMSFIKEKKRITQNDINFVQIIANHAGIALHQSMLYHQAQENSKAKSEFITNMSHEIKTPLNIIMGFSELLSEKEIDRDKQIKYLQHINSSGKHLLNITNEIIDLSKLESGNYSLDYEKINSKELIINLINAMKLISDNKKIEINTNLTDAKILADKKKFTQIIFNLMSNAIKFTEEGGKIEIKSEVKDKNIIISIEDNGIGLQTKDFDTIFEEFKQVDSSVERKQEGAGLGLTITKRLIELHNGEIFVESKENEGSKFWFKLPI